MKIIVTNLPKMPQDCLFSKWNCEYGWFCTLYNCKHHPEQFGLGSYECDVNNCPYLQEEK